MTNHVSETKHWRLILKDLAVQMQRAERTSRSRSLALTKIQEASNWLREDLQELNEPDTAPNSLRPNVAKIDPPAPEDIPVAKPKPPLSPAPAAAAEPPKRELSGVL